MNNYEVFHQLHHKDKPLVIANAWNVKSARIIEQNGFDAIATSSGAISESMGYEDGEKMPFEELRYIVQRITASTNIPVSVDLERGYTDDLGKLTTHIQQLIDIGVVGINLEDAQGEDIFLKKLDAVKNYLEQRHEKLFINARTDVFLQKLESPLELTIKRAKLYEDAGANGLFVPAVADPLVINAIAAATSLPLNVVATPRISSFATLAECGVRRISMAVFLYKAAYQQLENFTKAVISQQSLGPLF